MLAAAATTGLSTYMHWLPCRGSMLRGSIVHGYDYDGGKFSDLCLRRMDGDQGPWESELNVAAMVLLGLAWLALVLGLRWKPRTKVVAALPGLATLAFAAALPIAEATAHPDSPVLMVLVLAIEGSVLIPLIAIPAWQPDVQGRHLLRLLVVLWGTTAYGFVHGMAEYAIMIRFSDANWDCPPGTGYLTVAAITISAIVTTIMTLRAPPECAAEPNQDHHSGLFTFAS